MKITDWHNCYNDGWQGIIVPEAFAHPAKMAHGLLRRIIRHGLVNGYWTEGDTLGEPFGGVLTTGILAAYHGLKVISVELEPRFVDLANQNIALHRQRWQLCGDPEPVIIQGDSRRFAELVGSVAGVVSSPPFCDSGMGDRRVNGGLKDPAANRGHSSLTSSKTGGGGKTDYGQTPGQISALPPGNLDGVISSPPYAEAIGNTNGIDYSKAKGKHDGLKPSIARDSIGGPYGAESGQIGSLKEGTLSGAITSPPYAETAVQKNSSSIDRRKQYETYRQQGGGASYEAFAATQSLHSGDYGSSVGQIGALKEGVLDGAVTSPPFAKQSHHGGDTETARGLGRTGRSQRPTEAAGNHNLTRTYGASDGQIDELAGETYWQAMAQVYSQMQLAVKPGGVCAIVLKSYVKGGKLVDLPSQTCTLLESLGFTVFERTRCWLVKSTSHPSLFGGEPHVKTTERKSFFRRLAEKNGSPRIDYEEVIWTVK